MVFCNPYRLCVAMPPRHVTILILIDGFLQYNKVIVDKKHKISHNPYFNRWFSAIYNMVEK